MSRFPQPFESTISHWQASNRGRTALWNHNKDAALPSRADIVIIGGGITGASLAYHLTRPGGAGEGQAVVVLEAKDLASGATGRNGGHIAPFSFTGFLTLTAKLSESGAGLSDEDALDVLENEQDTLRCAQQIIKDEGIDANLWVGQKLEVQVTPEGVRKARKAWEAYQAARQRSPRYRNEPIPYEFIDDPVKASQLSRVKHALSVARMPAGSCHPHRLATALMRRAMDTKTSSCDFYSWAPAERVERSSGGWKVTVQERGSIATGKVVLATNAHTKWLLPEGALDISQHITPYRGHAALVVPPTSVAGPAALDTTYSLEMGPYLMTTPHSGIVLGCYNATALAAGIARRHEIWGMTDDSVVLPAFSHWLEHYCGQTFDDWTPPKPGEGISRVWSGIMGASRDLLPLVGEVPGAAGLYAAVAFNGHGMARILTATRGLALHLKQGSWDERLPKVFAITEERLRSAQEQVPDLLGPEDIAEGSKLAEGTLAAKL